MQHDSAAAFGKGFPPSHAKFNSSASTPRPRSAGRPHTVTPDGTPRLVLPLIVSLLLVGCANTAGAAGSAVANDAVCPRSAGQIVLPRVPPLLPPPHRLGCRPLPSSDGRARACPHGFRDERADRNPCISLPRSRAYRDGAIGRLVASVLDEHRRLNARHSCQANESPLQDGRLHLYLRAYIRGASSHRVSGARCLSSTPDLDLSAALGATPDRAVIPPTDLASTPTSQAQVKATRAGASSRFDCGFRAGSPFRAS